jgi:hypothetical protein
MADGINFPILLAAGSFDASSGAVVVSKATQLVGLQAANIVRNSKGNYSITIPSKPSLDNALIQLDTLGANQACASGGYTAATGVLVVLGTDLANAGADVAVSFMVWQLSGTA